MSWRWWDGPDPALEQAEQLRHQRGSGDPNDYAPRYAGLDDRVLAIALAREDAAEDRGVDPDGRATCHPHRTWFDDEHAATHRPNPVSGWQPPERPRITDLRMDPSAGLVCGEIELPGGLPPEDPEHDAAAEVEA